MAVGLARWARPGVGRGRPALSPCRPEGRPGLRPRALLPGLALGSAGGALLVLAGLSFGSGARLLIPVAPPPPRAPTAVIGVAVFRDGAGVRPFVVLGDRTGHPLPGAGEVEVRLYEIRAVPEGVEARRRPLWQAHLRVAPGAFEPIRVASGSSGYGVVPALAFDRVPFSAMAAWPDDDSSKWATARFVRSDGAVFTWEGEVSF